MAQFQSEGPQRLNDPNYCWGLFIGSEQRTDVFTRIYIACTHMCSTYDRNVTYTRISFVRDS